MGLTPGKPVTFGLAELCEWSAATGPQVEHWVRHGIIVPLQESEGRGSPRVFSLQNVIEAAMARELQSTGLSRVQMKTVFAQHRETVSALPLELRASATFVRFVEIVRALVKIKGQGPDYPQWDKDVDSFIRSWKTKQTPLDERILQILAGARAAERDAAQGNAQH